MSSARDGAEEAPDVSALTQVVSRLRDHVAQLEGAAAGAAVLERAKGVLMASLGLSEADAHQELIRRAERHDRPLTEECEAVLGVSPRGLPATSPPAATEESAGPVSGRRRHLARRPGQNDRFRPAEEVLAGLAADLAQAHSAPTVATCLRKHLHGPADVDAVLIYQSAAEAGLDLRADAGLDPLLSAQWRHVPPAARIAPAEAIATGRPVWLEDSGKDAGRYALIGEPSDRWPSRAWFPVPAAPAAGMAVGLLCNRPGPFPAATRQLLQEAVRLCTAALDGAGPGAGRAADPDSDLVADLFAALPGSAVLLTPVRNDGVIEDFRVEAAAPDTVDPAGRRGKELVGLRVLETFPHVVGTPLWQGCMDALATGTTYEGELFTSREADSGLPDTSTCAVRAVPWHGRLIASWTGRTGRTGWTGPTGHDGESRQAHRLAVLQRLGKLGWADWDLVAGTVVWSEEVYGIFHRDPAAGPLPLDELPLHLLHDDLPATAAAVRRLLGDGEPIDHTFRVVTGEGVRHIRMLAEADTDAQGDPVEVHGFFQNLTAQRQAELELVESERALVVQQGLLEAERQLARRLQHALLPISEQSLRLAGLDVEVAYLPSEGGINVGGDWYSAIELPGGHALFVVGDVAGHGLDAVATMAQLRFTAKGMVVTGSPLTEALRRLNTLLLHTADSQNGTATLILARYDPAGHRLSWVQAGHPPPLLVRDGAADFLTPPEGILLGATREPHYTEAHYDLRAGDHLIFYTDGLVEKPSEHLDKGMHRLAQAARTAFAGPTPESLPHMLSRLLPRTQRRDDTCVLALHLP
ncbi:SpoIIE family protein phosphatase [Streptomyces sp. NPDC051211]|uniref:SpoIIE family protein phosphatase n=1 Tax=Streptomyces sp. NPDC051211 TaxID=3154643 RepID=UPI00344D4B31